MSDKTWVTGEFVETVQLQVVCQTLINKLAPNENEISMTHLEQYGSLDKALQFFYEDSLKEVVEKTKEILLRKGEPEIKEGTLRTWFEKKLITPALTRGLAYRGATHTEGLSNEAVDVLDQAHIIREERRGSGRWYELSHDRFVDPILTSNKDWLVQYAGAAKVREWLEERAARWQRTQDEADLLGENEIAEAERWISSAEASVLGYDPTVTRLIQSSKASIKSRQVQRQLEFETARRLAKSARRFKWASVGLATMFILALATTLIAADQWKQAQANAQLAKAGELAAERAQRSAEQAQREALAWANSEVEAKKEAAKRAEEAENAKAEAERAKIQLAEALKKAEQRAREAERARKTDQLSRAAFRLSRRPESREEAVAQFANAIKVYQQTGDRDAQADIYLNQGQVYRDMGEEERAEEAFNHAVELYRSKDPLKQADTLNNIGLIYSSQSDDASNANEQSIPTAQTKFYGALAIYRRHRDIFGEAATLSNLGEAQLGMGKVGDRRRSVDYYSQAADIYGNQVDSPKAMKALATMFMTVANNFSLLLADDLTFTTDDRLELYEDAIGTYDKLGDKRGRAIALTKMAEFAEEELQTAEGPSAERYRAMVLSNYNEAAKLYKDCGDTVGEAGSHIRLGDYYEALEDRQEKRKAIVEYRQALKIYREIKDRAGEIRAHKLLAEFFSKSPEAEDKTKALEVLTKMGQLYQELENIRGQRDTYVKLGALHESRQERKEAEVAFNEARSLYKASGDRRSEADVLSDIGDIYAEATDQAGIDLAVQRLVEASEIYKETKSVESLARTYEQLADIYRGNYGNTSATSPELTSRQVKAVEYYVLEGALYVGKDSKSDKVKLAKIERAIGQLYRDRLGDKEKALEHLNKAMKLYEEGRNPTYSRLVKMEIDRMTKPPAQKQ